MAFPLSNSATYFKRQFSSDAASLIALKCAASLGNVAKKSATESASTLDQQVELRQLDSYHFEDVKFIKIDVEGHEGSVIEGAAETIRSMKPSMLIEIEQRHNGTPVLEMFNKIMEFEFKGYFLRKGKLVSVDEFDLKRDQNPNNLGNSKQEYINNFIFIHESRVKGYEGISI